MRPPRLFPLALVLVVVAGCVYVPLGTFAKIKAQGVPAAVTPPGQTPLEIGGLRVGVDIRDGELTAQALVNPYTKADVDHLVLKLFRLDGGSEAPLVLGGKALEADVASGDIPHSASFGGFEATGSYRVRAYAYKAPGTAARALISADSALVDVVLDSASTVSATLSIRLVDRAFAGQGTSSFDITEGTVTDAPQETIE